MQQGIDQTRKRMKKITVLIILFTAYSNLYSQDNTGKVLIEIEKNNTTLSALRKLTDARKTGNKTGIYPSGPEAGFNYLNGTAGNRTDLSIIQSFDFPSVYVRKGQISNLLNDQADLEYQKQLKTVLLQARLICSDLIYTNALKNEYTVRLDHARKIAASFQSKFNTGETNILELNKAKLNLLNSVKELEALEISRNHLLMQLSALNGGQPLSFNDSVFFLTAVNENFEQWFSTAVQNNPDIALLRKEADISKKQVDLSRAQNMPRLSAGYMSEIIPGEEEFRGITAGISIPLWENNNKTRYARANAKAIESLEADSRMQFHNRLKALHSKIIASMKIVADYRTSLVSLDNAVLLQKALDYGEVSLIDYMFELSIYYDSVNMLLELERDLAKSIDELNQYM